MKAKEVTIKYCRIVFEKHGLDFDNHVFKGPISVNEAEAIRELLSLSVYTEHCFLVKAGVPYERIRTISSLFLSKVVTINRIREYKKVI